MTTEISKLQQEYHTIESTAHRFAIALYEQIEHLLEENQVPLGVRIDHRVKSWDSIAEKLDRKKITLSNIAELTDLIGLRLMLLFRRDVEKTCDLICTTFEVLEREDTRDRLQEDQFGYQSFHLVIALPKTWLQIPSLKGFAELKAEIQVRTLTQHIWAASSHFLQYKQKRGVPLPVRRSIHRVSALLETVDLEFERVLQDREQYLDTVSEPSQEDSLNVDLLAQILNLTLPKANKEAQEPYGEILEDLAYFEVRTVRELRELLKATLPKVLVKEREEVAKAKKQLGGHPGTTRERTERGVYFTHAGLVRTAIAESFGDDKWFKYVTERIATHTKSQTENRPNKCVDSDEE